MTLEDQLRRAAEAVVTAEPDAGANSAAHTTDSRTNAVELARSYEELKTEFAQRKQDPAWLLATDGIVADAQLGPAAYALGVHYIVQDQFEEADRWLRIAAEQGVGDAALRLAHLCELRAVNTFNSSGDDPYLSQLSFDQTVEARYWYDRARVAGYGTGPTGTLGRVEQPTVPLDCCSDMARKRASDEAEAVLCQARQDAEKIIRNARADARQILDDARCEVEQLATRREAMAAQLNHVRAWFEGALALSRRRAHARSGGVRSWLRRCLTGGDHDTADALGAVGGPIDDIGLEYFTRVVRGIESSLSAPPDGCPREVFTGYPEGGWTACASGTRAATDHDPPPWTGSPLCARWNAA